jgi:putative cardiolipin synthase
VADPPRFGGAHRGSAKARAYLDAVRRHPLLAEMTAGTLEFDWVAARVISDAPEKVLLPTDRRDVHLVPQLQEAFGHAERELVLVSPYFVPGAQGTANLVAMAARGVQVTVLTNSLAATDVGVVYAGYQHYRRDLLRAGVRLYELKRAAVPSGADDDPRSAGIVGSGVGSSSASLHAKTFAVDRARIFVGSFNLDPRSVALNTEMGVVLESPALARTLSDAARDVFLRNAYELRLEGDNVVWIEHTAAGEVRHAKTPGVGLLRNLWIGFLSLLPIEHLL